MITVPTVYVVLALLVPVVVGYAAVVRWLDRRYIDPWLRRRCGIPPNDQP